MSCACWSPNSATKPRSHQLARQRMRKFERLTSLLLETKSSLASGRNVTERL
jgi:hypothetical protein